MDKIKIYNASSETTSSIYVVNCRQWYDIFLEKALPGKQNKSTLFSIIFYL